MNDIFNGTILTAFALFIFSSGIAFFINLWIHYSENENKYPFFPILNPFNLCSYELLLTSIFRLEWKKKVKN